MAAAGKTSTLSAVPSAGTSDRSATGRTARDVPRDARELSEAPSVTKPSVWQALKAVGAALKGLAVAMPQFLRLAMIWVGIPLAVGTFAISVAYHGLRFYLDSQAKANAQWKKELSSMRKEHKALAVKLDEALTASATAKVETRAVKDRLKAANDETKKARDDAEVAREALAKATKELAVPRK